jgi:EAL domain-containing protein (putative c-di-GMP-specific phosphodiesterase class I)
MGIVVYPNDGADVNELLKNAASAMHHAKDCGKNNYQFFTESINEKAYERLSMANKLHSALEREELYLLYQPKIDIQRQQIVGFEALVRWQHPVLGSVPPSRFIPVAEETGLIVPLGEWVLRTACLQNKLWQESGYPHLKIAVNVSSRQFNGGRLVDTVNIILNETGLDPHSLELELTEGVLMENTEITGAVLSQLKALGVDIALDDFGTGYSSLSYLNSFPIDVIKIDQSFARNITNDRNSGAIALAIIALSRSLNLEVVAEGVELEPQLDFMRRHGCNIVQGYYFSPPISADQASALLENFLYENQVKAAL